MVSLQKVERNSPLQAFTKRCDSNRTAEKGTLHYLEDRLRGVQSERERARKTETQTTVGHKSHHASKQLQKMVEILFLRLSMKLLCQAT